MKKIFTFSKLILVVGLSMATLVSCEKKDDVITDDGGSGSSSSSKKKLVKTEEQANIVADDIWQLLVTIDNETSVSSYSGDRIPSPSSGYALISGSKSSKSETSYTTSVTTNFEITLCDYVEGGRTYSGTITYHQQMYSSSKYKRIRTAQGSGIKVSCSDFSDVVSVDMQRYHSSKTKTSALYPVSASVTNSAGTKFSVFIED